MEYYNESCLRRAGDQSGRAIKLDNITLAKTIGKFAGVCIEIDLWKLLRAGYRMQSKNWQLQYEVLQDMYFCCGKYGHQEANCTMRKSNDLVGVGALPVKDGGFGGSPPVMEAKEIPRIAFE